jgi:hypothetical protein
VTTPGPRLGVPGLHLGAPGVYPAPVGARSRDVPAVRAVRLDVAGFAGVAPRGPANVPVAVESWSDYQRRFGRFEGPGRLPYAVAAFFDQGGARAWVVRVVPPRPPGVAATDPDPAAADATARHRLDPRAVRAGDGASLDIAARDEGAWGDGLTLTLSFVVAQRFTAERSERADRSADPARPVAAVGAGGIALPVADVPVGSLLRVTGPGIPGVGVLRWVLSVPRREPVRGRRVPVVLDEPLPGGGGTGPGGGVVVEVVTATLAVGDGDPAFPRTETWSDLGLHPAHPRALAQVLTDSSTLVAPSGPWPALPVRPAGPLLGAATSSLVHAGSDRYDRVVRRSFFDDEVSPDPDAGGPDGSRHTGVDALAAVPEIGIVAVPDLLYRWAPAGVTTVPAGAVAGRERGFAPCPVPEPPMELRVPPRPHLLDAVDDLDEILVRQRALVARAGPGRAFVVLLDCPFGLPAGQLQRWRAAFDPAAVPAADPAGDRAGAGTGDPSYAAAYHPWLGTSRDDDERDGLVMVPPSGFAAGVVAARELRRGLPWGPSNELARGAVAASDVTTDAERALLHGLGINVFVPERAGFRLTSARTLSREADYRQLSVRRLLIMLRLSLERELWWAVFEPHTGRLRTQLCVQLTAFLRRLFRAGAFAGDREDQAFFVHCDDALNPRESVAQGRLVIEVGVAPAEPLEFIVLRVALAADRDVSVEVRT